MENQDIPVELVKSSKVSSLKEEALSLESPRLRRNIALAGAGQIVTAAFILRKSNSARIALAACGVANLAGAAWMYGYTTRFKLKHRDHLLQLANLQAGTKVLEIGAGNGFLTLEIARQVGPTGEVFASEYDPEAREMLEQNLVKEKLIARVHLVENEPYRLPYPDAYFTTIISNEGFDTLLGNNRERAMQEITRVLLPGGLLIFAGARHMKHYFACATASGLSPRLLRANLGTLPALSAVTILCAVKPEI